MKISRNEKIFDKFNIILLLAIAMLTLYPLWREISLSLSSMTEAMKGGAFLYPKEFTLSAYKSVFSGDYLWLAYKNTIFTTVVGTSLSVLFTSMIAYSLSKSNLPGKKIILTLVIFTMLFSGGLIPTYLVVKNLHLINSLWSLVLIDMITAYNTFIMLSFFRSIPKEIEESAFIDGANPIVTFFYIVLPLSKPVLATIALWVGVALWNNFFNAMIYLNDTSKFTLQLLLRNIISGQEMMKMTGEIVNSSTESVIGATIVLSILPIICVYPFLQKYFVTGVMIGSVKG